MKRPSWLVALRVEGKYIGLDAGKDITKRRHPQRQVDHPLQRSFASAPSFRCWSTNANAVECSNRAQAGKTSR